MKPTARRSGRPHWIIGGVTFLLLALVAWREGRSLVHVITGGYDEHSWFVPPNWVAVLYATGAGRDTGVTIIPPEWLRGVGREVLFPRITRLP